MNKKPFAFLLVVVLLLISAGCKKTPTLSPTDEIDATENVPVQETDAYPVIEDTTYPVLEQPSEEPTAPPLTEEPPLEDTSTPEPSPTESIMLQMIEMFPDGTGWGLANRHNLYNTNDGGLTWHAVTPDSPLIPSDGYGPSVFSDYLDGRTAWYLLSDYESSTLFHTADAGRTWVESALPFPGGYLQFLDANEGYLMSDLGVGAGSQWVAFYHTVDGGLTWEMRFTHEPGIDKDLPGSGIKSGFAFLDINNGWVTGSVPMEDFVYLYRTINGAVNWDLVPFIIPDDLSAMFFETWPPHFTDTNTGFLPIRALGSGDEFPLVFFQTVDGGETWQLRGRVEDASRYDFASTSVGIAGGEHTLYLTTDGAQTWLDLTANLPAGETLLQVEIVSENVAWLVTTPTPDDLSVLHLYRSVDGGGTWQLLPASLVPGYAG